VVEHIYEIHVLLTRLRGFGGGGMRKWLQIKAGA